MESLTKSPRMNGTSKAALTKVPEVTLVFWIIKIAATTLGETGGDAVTMSMNLGYAVGTAIFARSSSSPSPRRSARSDSTRSCTGP